MISEVLLHLKGALNDGRRDVALVMTIAVALFGTTAPAMAAAVGSTFTYQGHLKEMSSLARGHFDFRFELYDAVEQGNQIGDTVTKEDVEVSHGLFRVDLDFGSDAFDGEARWLEIGIRARASTGDYTHFPPRQPIQPTPYALHALNAGTNAGSGVPSGAVLAFDLADCPAGWEPYTAGAGRVIVGSGEGAGLSSRSVGDKGGNELVTLTEENLPPQSPAGQFASADHHHVIPLMVSYAGGIIGVNESPEGFSGYTGNFRGNTSQGQRVATSQVGLLSMGGQKASRMSSGKPSDSASVGETGGGAAHENMPPFVVLTVCRKE